MRTLELKIPPPAVALATAALMWLVSRATPSLGWVFPARAVAASGVAAIGVLTAISGVLALRRAQTTLNPMKPDSATSLVASGSYTVTRNPMYLGLLLALTGWAIFLSNALVFIFLPAFVLYMNRFQIEPEERTLASRFGQDFVAYKSRVRRWL
jgi:protein-S-isoprenylcysteine O-methyltransferase Ste14